MIKWSKLSKQGKKEEIIEKRISGLEERQTALERQFNDGLSGTTLILGACDIDEIVSVIEKRLTKRQQEGCEKDGTTCNIIPSRTE